jgi:restriction system protein
MIINVWEIAKNILVGLLDAWQIWLILAALIIIIIFFKQIDKKIDGLINHRRFKKGEAWRSDRDLLRWLRGMRPAEFEKYISDLYSRLGYKTEAVGRSHDGGIDVIAEKDGVINYIQCKKFITSKVPVGAVRDFYGALADHLANGQGYFITTNEFTLEAQQFAKDKPIELVDGFVLAKYIHLANKDSRIDVTTNTLSPQICPKCGGSLVERDGKFGVFNGCTNYPKCRYSQSKDT